MRRPVASPLWPHRLVGYSSFAFRDAVSLSLECREFE
mgnify:CR=1 FL=1